MYCPKCGNQLREGAAFCNRCGADLNNDDSKTAISVEIGQKQFVYAEPTFSSSSRNAILVLAIASLILNGVARMLWGSSLSSSIVWLLPSVLMIIGAICSRKQRPVLMVLPLICESALDFWSVLNLWSFYSQSISSVISALSVEILVFVFDVIITIIVLLALRKKSSGLRITGIIFITLLKLYSLFAQISIILSLARSSAPQTVIAGRIVLILYIICSAVYWLICLFGIKTKEKKSHSQNSTPIAANQDICTAVFCPNCGRQFPQGKVFCDQCGTKLEETALTAPIYEQAQNNSPDTASTGYGVLGFFFPMIGLILYLVWKDSLPLRSKSVGKGALAGAITYVALIVLIYVIYFIFLASLF